MGKRIDLLYMDTDSFVYCIYTYDFYEDIKDDVRERFDTINYTNNNLPLEIGVNKKVIGMMKDEVGGKHIEEFVSINAKMYSYSIEG